MTRTVLLVLGLLALGLAPVSAEGAEPATCAGRTATIVGTPGGEIIRGTPGPDVIAALGGNDVVRPGAGDDVVCGGAGHDYLVSHRGADLLRGGPQSDRIEGLSSAPTRVLGGRGPDLLFLAITDEPGYVLDGGAGDDIGDLRLQLDATVGGPALVIDRGDETLTRGGVLTGVFARIERLGLDERMPYEYDGTSAPDLVSVADGDFPFRAETHGGDDDVTTYAGDDYVDAGRGDDRVDAGPGTDTCLNAERTRGCENVS